MATFEENGVRLKYEVQGKGFPVLAIAPGGMRSTLKRWENVWNLPFALRKRGYQVVTMDQRNAGRSWAPVNEQSGWSDYTADQLALMDHLGHEKFHVVGMCIGGSYGLGLIDAAPERIASAVLLQPIGFDDNRDVFYDLFDGWAAEIAAQHPEASEADWAAFRETMYGGEFVFNLDQQAVAAMQTPILVLQGDDVYHPASTSREIVDLAPNARLVEYWKEGEHAHVANAAVFDFLAEHS